MQTKEQRYDSAVKRNLHSAKFKRSLYVNKLPHQVKSMLGIRNDDKRFDEIIWEEIIYNTSE